MTLGFYSLCKFGHAAALINLNMCDLVLLSKIKFGQERPVEPLFSYLHTCFRRICANKSLTHICQM